MTPAATPALTATVADRSLVLPWALAASFAVHGGLLIANLGGMAGGEATAPPPALYATLRPAEVATERASTELLAVSAPADAPRAATPPAAEPASSPPTRAAKARGSTTPAGESLALPLVTAAILTDRNRWGDLSARQGVEFPIEIDQPVRMIEPISVRYPAAAFAQGREDSVGVWIVVNADGNAEEVKVLDGSAEFADEVISAVAAARFEPAQNRLHRIRFPIALEFRFRTDAVGTAVATAAAR